MANIYTIIQRKVNHDEFDFTEHALQELIDEDFYLSDAVQVIYGSFRNFQYNADQSHVRYAFDGKTIDGRILRVIVFIQHGRVKIKTCYEIFE